MKHVTREAQNIQEIIDLINDPKELAKRLAASQKEQSHWVKIIPTEHGYPDLKPGDRVRFNFGGRHEEKVLNEQMIKNGKFPAPGHGMVVFLYEAQLYVEDVEKHLKEQSLKLHKPAYKNR